MTSVPPDLLTRLAGTDVGKSPSVRAGQRSSSFDLEKWISDHGLQVTGPDAWKGGRRWVFPVCPWNPDHRNRSAFIIQNAEGAIGAGCQHTGCRDKRWHDLRDVVEPGWRSKRNLESLTQSEASGDWGPILPFYQPILPPFPDHTLPDWLRDFVLAVATATQTPIDLAAMLALAVIAAACAKKIQVRLKVDHIEPVNIFVVVALPPGNRKSAVFKEVTRPLENFERDEAQRAEGEIARQQSQRKIKEARLKKLEQQAGDAKGSNQSLVNQAIELAEEIALMPVPSRPRYIVDDCTPEKLAGMLSEQGGRIAVMSAEGDVFEMMAGRYSNNAGVGGNLSVYLKGHAGDQLRVDRVGRATEFIDSPALTLGLAVQPEVLRGLMDKPGFRGRGLIGRLLFSLPISLLGRRDTDPPAIPDDVRRLYDSNILQLLKLPFSIDALGKSAAHSLELEPDASALMREFSAWIEPQLSEFGELGSMTDWAAKLVGAVGRLVGILHMAAHAHERAPWEVAVSAETIGCAIAIGRYCIPHAKAALAEMSADPAQEQAKRILRWIESRKLRRFAKRDLHQALRGTFKKVNELDVPLELLERQAYIRKQEQAEREGAGRHPSPTYEVNPLWRPQNTRNPQNSLSETNSEYCEDSEERGKPARSTFNPDQHEDLD